MSLFREYQEFSERQKQLEKEIITISKIITFSYYFLLISIFVVIILKILIETHFIIL